MNCLQYYMHWYPRRFIFGGEAGFRTVVVNIIILYVQFYSVKVVMDGRKICGMVPHICVLRSGDR